MEESERAEAALAALSFLSENLTFESREYRDDLHPASSREGRKSAEEGKFSPSIESTNKREVTVLKEKPVGADLIPDWVDSYHCTQDDDTCEGSEEQAEETHSDVDPAEDLSWIEGLGTDLSALILSHLTVQEISLVSFVSRAMRKHSRSNGLWRLKFTARWNADFVSQCCSVDGSWLSCFQEAYANPHDLWMTHWNCVFPDDADSPGRCCIPHCIRGAPDPTYSASDEHDNYRSHWMKYCPTCRYQSSSHELPFVVQEAMESERLYQATDSMGDPVERAETVAAAHALLLNDKHGDKLTTSRAKTIFATTQCSIAKFCRKVQSTQRLDHEPQRISSNGFVRRARHAFLCAATFHRQIRPEQYQSYGLHFLTDALFFGLGAKLLEETKEGRAEKDHLRQDIYGGTDDPSSPNQPGTVSNLGHQIETSRHTWHIVRFTNPDFTRPLSFRVYVQRPDCFTVFPSEGYLEPGQSCHIVLGVRPLGSLLSQAFEALNVQREEVDPFLADVYSTEAHLPYAPYAVRYMFAPVTPCIPPSFTSRGDIRTSQTLVRPTWTQAASSKYKHVMDYLWDNVATEADFRTQYLSAHVNANYGFDEFQRATLFPFDLKVRESEDWGAKEKMCLEPLVFVAPNLLQKDPLVFNVLQNLHEMELSDAGVACRTEKGCRVCGRDWGARSEELGRAYMLRKLVCEAEERKRNRKMVNLIECLRCVYAMVICSQAPGNATESSTKSVVLGTYEFLHSVHAVLVQKRATRLVSSVQRNILFRIECVVDDLCTRVQEQLLALEEGPHEHPLYVNHDLASSDQFAVGNEWRTAGVYRHVTCTDSVFGCIDVWGGSDISEDIAATSSAPCGLSDSTTVFKDEPEYLDGFRHLCHSPGLYCLGRQEDPNHDDTDVQTCGARYPKLNQRFYRQTWDRHTDIYMDSSMFAFASALSMIHDPRSLLVHGVYDRIRSAGSIIRRPMIPDLSFQVTTSYRDADDLARKVLVLLENWQRRQHRYAEKNGSWLTDVAVPHGLRGSRRVCLHMNDIDPESHQLMHLSLNLPVINGVDHISSWRNFIDNIPQPGLGRFLLSAESKEPRTAVVPIAIFSGADKAPSMSEQSEQDQTEPDPVHAQQQPPGNHQNGQNANGLAAAFNGNLRGPRLLNVLFLLSAHFGWSVDESQGPGATLVDRRILIATQWVSNSLMALPLIATLIARFTLMIAPKPIDYHLEGLPYDVDSNMRYFTGMECVCAALVVASLWLVMGRYSERRIGRTFERAMMEHWPASASLGPDPYFAKRIFVRAILWCQRRWDRVCPLFLQRLVFSPRWNRRGRRELLKHILSWRSKDFREHRSVFRSDSGRGIKTFGVGGVGDAERPIETAEESSTRKVLICLLISLGSFCASSPHFFLNLLTVFCCSIGLGMSMSLQSMEPGRGVSSATNTRSILKPFGLNTLVIGFFLVGQLVGSSGGVLFLAEFVVTTISLVLGGAGTISAAAMESWAVFFMLSSTAFWGYLFARVALMDGMRRKRRGASSTVLCTALLVATFLWFGALFIWEWELPPALMIVRTSLSRDRRTDRKYISQQLQ